MFTRGRLFLHLSLLSFGAVSISPAGAAALEVHVHNGAELKPVILDRLLSDLQAILASAGASADVRTCRGENVSWCNNPSAGARVLYLEILAGTGEKIKDIRHPPLGRSVANAGGDYATIYLATVQSLAERANVPWTAVAPYAAAHEIGHLLLGSNAHTRNGVMKDTWDAKDLLAMYQNAVHFAPEQKPQIANCCGERRGGELSAAH